MLGDERIEIEAISSRDRGSVDDHVTKFEEKRETRGAMEEKTRKSPTRGRRIYYSRSLPRFSGLRLFCIYIHIYDIILDCTIVYVERTDL